MLHVFAPLWSQNLKEKRVRMFANYFRIFQLSPGFEQFLPFSSLVFIKCSRTFANVQCCQNKIENIKIDYISILIFCRYFGIWALGEIKMKVDILSPKSAASHPVAGCRRTTALRLETSPCLTAVDSGRKYRDCAHVPDWQISRCLRPKCRNKKRSEWSWIQLQMLDMRQMRASVRRTAYLLPP